MSMIWKSDPWLIVSGVLRSLVQIILPYITIVFSAEVINALTGNYYKRALKIVGWMSASVLVVKCVEAFLEAMKIGEKISLDLYMKEKLNQICYGVKLEKLESHNSNKITSRRWTAWIIAAAFMHFSLLQGSRCE